MMRELNYLILGRSLCVLSLVGMAHDCDAFNSISSILRTNFPPSFSVPLHNPDRRIQTTTTTINTKSTTSSLKMSESKCPFGFTSQVNEAAIANDRWFPEALNLRSLQQNHPQYKLNDPHGTDPDFNYAEEFAALDLTEVKKDINAVLTTSQEWWPADYGNYGPLMIRLAWHSAGTYRTYDGRGGTRGANQRFAPLNSWPDNGNLDKARRLLWPIKQKYGRKLSWADLFVLTGNQALETMGLKPFGFGGGREDIYAPEYDIYWGKEQEMLADERHDDNDILDDPLAAVVQGLIYVNPEGTADSTPDPLKAAKDIRETFGKMGFTNDYDVVALVAGGHTFGKSHGAYSDDELGPGPEGSGLAAQNLGYKNEHGSGRAEHATTSGLEGAWTQNPTRWDMDYIENLFKYEWEMHKGPGGKWQWKPKDTNADKTPDAHVEGKLNDLMMLTTDVALVKDPEYLQHMKHFRENPDDFALAFAKAWYFLTHRDSGPVQRLIGDEVPPAQLWQDPISDVDHPLVDAKDIAELKTKIVAGVKTGSSLKSKIFGSKSGVAIAQLVKVAWGSASTFRQTDYRGGANGGRIRLAPQNEWPVNEPDMLKTVLARYENIQKEFNDAHLTTTGKKISMADLIVLGGCAAIEEASRAAGLSVEVPFTPGRMDATAEQTDVENFQVLEPKADAFRNYYHSGSSNKRKAEEMMIDRASLLGLTAPEMTVLVGGMRALGANACNDDDDLGVLTAEPGKLTNDFFVNLLDMDTKWEAADKNEETFLGLDRKNGKKMWKASRVDMAFGSSSELRGIAEVYACSDSRGKFVRDFVAAWTKVMNADRYDL